jgi:TPP-dependent pyruvate/acetoin dehydrogenase alpha subunit
LEKQNKNLRKYFMKNDKVPYYDLYKKMFLIRAFETRLLKLFEKGKLFGTTHTYVGQEAIAVSIITNLIDSDVVFSNHRCHGHFLTKENDPKALLAEIMGKDKGVCGGRGGSQHICKNNFFSNGIQGSIVPNALGVAFAEKYNQTGNIVVTFIGDGTLGEGAVYETLNMASLWQVPLLVIVENNRYAQTTPIEHNLAGSIVERARSFDIKAGEIESNDVGELFPRFKDIIDNVRTSNSPQLEVVHTYRLNAHSKGDDFRNKEEIDSWKEKDPLRYPLKHITNTEKDKIEMKVIKSLQFIEEEVNSMPFATID